MLASDTSSIYRLTKRSPGPTRQLINTRQTSRSSENSFQERYLKFIPSFFPLRIAWNSDEKERAFWLVHGRKGSLTLDSASLGTRKKSLRKTWKFFINPHALPRSNSISRRSARGDYGTTQVTTCCTRPRPPRRLHCTLTFSSASKVALAGFEEQTWTGYLKLFFSFNTCRTLLADSSYCCWPSILLIN